MTEVDVEKLLDDDMEKILQSVPEEKQDTFEYRMACISVRKFRRVQFTTLKCLHEMYNYPAWKIFDVILATNIVAGAGMHTDLLSLGIDVGDKYAA